MSDQTEHWKSEAAEAVEYGDVDRLRVLLAETPADYGHGDPVRYGMPLLHLAAALGRGGACELLLLAGHSPLVRDAHGRPAALQIGSLDRSVGTERYRLLRPVRRLLSTYLDGAAVPPAEFEVDMIVSRRAATSPALFKGVKRPRTAAAGAVNQMLARGRLPQVEWHKRTTGGRVWLLPGEEGAVSSAMAAALLDASAGVGYYEVCLRPRKRGGGLDMSVRVGARPD